MHEYGPITDGIETGRKRVEIAPFSQNLRGCRAVIRAQGKTAGGERAQNWRDRKWRRATNDRVGMMKQRSTKQTWDDANQHHECMQSTSATSSELHRRPSIVHDIDKRQDERSHALNAGRLSAFDTEQTRRQLVSSASSESTSVYTLHPSP